jgi:hypothetical protein
MTGIHRGALHYTLFVDMFKLWFWVFVCKGCLEMNEAFSYKQPSMGFKSFEGFLGIGDFSDEI